MGNFFNSLMDILTGNESKDNSLMHYGVARRSGRYPYGSGDNPYQHNGDFLSRVEEYKDMGYTEKQICELMDIPSTTEYRKQWALARSERRELQAARVKALREDGYSLKAIANEMGFANDSSVRALLNEDAYKRTQAAKAAADIIRQAIEEKGMIDVGKGVERELGISKEKLNQALKILQNEGYELYGGRIPQVTNPGNNTTQKIICPKGTEHKEIFDYENVHTLTDYISYDEGTTFRKAFEYPESLDSSRLKIVYAEEGGIKKDGTILIRRGVEDISLGESSYAQVRIMVDGTHYLKGMALYSNDLPDGVDVLFNTNKKQGTPMTDVLKPIKDDPQNPFGSLIKEHGGQRYYDDPNGKFVDPVTGKKQSLSLINKTREEGEWGEWSKELSGQMLSKQSEKLIKNQLNLSIKDKEAAFEEIKSLTNPTIKRYFLEDFANNCESAAVHLKAAALPRQKYQVILPLDKIKDNEVFAPNYNHGEQVALIRFPHGGTFEIPILTVNNKNKEGVDILGKNAKDAIGINSKVASRLSGADFDGDTVLVIPVNDRVKIKSTPALEGLKDFEPKVLYGSDAGSPKVDSKGNEHYYRNGKEYKIMSKKYTQRQMGEVSNLITDMTLKGAPIEDIEKAVKHSMVVIDANKHKLDYKASEIDNDISTLKARWQGRVENGKYTESASTIISRSKTEIDVTKRVGTPTIDKDTGKLKYKEKVETYIDPKTGKVKERTTKAKLMLEVEDARQLSSGTIQEEAYASYANKMKAMANEARKELLSTERLKYSPAAKETYREEAKTLDAKLSYALSNAPREREAQRRANVKVKALKQDNPGMTKEELSKAKQRSLTDARIKVGAKRHPIEITDKEWSAIQAGAISDNKLTQILRFADTDKLKERATPRTVNTISDAKKSRITALKNSGYTNKEIADDLGISVSAIYDYLNE